MEFVILYRVGHGKPQYVGDFEIDGAMAVFETEEEAIRIALAFA